jgi:hypothetical protein
MKLRNFLIVAVIAVFAASCSTTYRASDTGLLISTEATRAFDLQYPNATNVVWSGYDANTVIVHEWDLADWAVIDDEDYVVQFDMDNERHYAWYDSNGDWIGTAYVINDFTRLPTPVSMTIERKFPGYTLTHVNKEFYKDRTAYEVVVKNDDRKYVALIDTDGTLIKTKLK